MYIYRTRTSVCHFVACEEDEKRNFTCGWLFTLSADRAMNVCVCHYSVTGIGRLLYLHLYMRKSHVAGPLEIRFNEFRKTLRIIISLGYPDLINYK